MHDSHWQWLEQGWTLVTANQRLARRLQYLYACRRLRAGDQAWETPAILSWQAWLQSLWQAWCYRYPDTLLLNPYQEQALWQRIIDESDYGGQLLHAANVARPVMEAWGILHQYRLPDLVGAANLNEDARAFANWAGRFRRHCEENNWCSSDTLSDRLAGDPPAPDPGRHQAVALLGFDRLNPQQQELFAVLERSGYRIRQGSPPVLADAGQCGVHGFADAAGEMKAAADWSRRLLEADPRTSIGIVLPALNQQREAVLQHFAGILQPERLLHCGADPGLPFSLSLGTPLRDYPLIDTALSLLQLAGHDASLADIGALLRSPYLAGAEPEAQARAELDARLRRHGEDRVNLRDLQHSIARLRDVDGGAESLLEHLDAAAAVVQDFPDRATPDTWAGHFSRLLTAFGWPGERSLNSAEQQLLQAWHELLGRFVSLQLVDTRMSGAAALGQLRRLAGDFRFQPETEETPVQILGPAGAADMGFDHLWVMGMHEDAWPPPVRPNPFLPLAWQRQHRVPGADAGLVLEQARTDLERLLAAVPDTVISYPCNEGERSLRPSPVVRRYAAVHPPGEMPETPDYLLTVRASGALERFLDVHAPALSGEAMVAGGAGLFRDQSACPFRGFARYRLYSGSPESVDIGLDPRERGRLLHEVLQRFWVRVGSQSALLQMSPAACQELINEVVTAVLEEGRRRQPRTYSDRFSALEQRRLVSLLEEWLEWEKERSPFRVLACEESQESTFNGLRLRTRIDRIDTLEDGREVIIDYKTGRCSENDWLGERPAEPQLPLYALLRPGPVAALAFACLRRGPETGYRGLAEEAGVLPETRAFSDTPAARRAAPDGEPLDWPGLLAAWRQTLEDIATGFRAGDARVDPRDAKACRYCDQHTLCRIYEAAGPGLARQEEDDDE